MRIGDFLTRNKTAVTIQDGIKYKRVTIRVRNGGVVLRDEVMGENIGTKRQFLVSEGQFIFSKIDARNGAMGIIPADLNGAVVTQDFLPYDIDATLVNPQYFVLVCTTKQFVSFCQSCSSGTTNRQRVDEAQFLNIKVPVPSLKEQDELVEEYEKDILLSTSISSKIHQQQQDISIKLLKDLGISTLQKKRSFDGCYKQLAFLPFAKMQNWSADTYAQEDSYRSSIYEVASLNDTTSLCIDIFRGKSPKYKDNTNAFILNQKCIRWGNIDKTFAKTVDGEWLKQIEPKFFTRKGDVLINSTGEGTIGRAAAVDKDNTGLLYDSHILLVRLNTKAIIPEYFAAVFNSEYGQEQVNNVKSAQSTNQTELGIGNLRKIFFPIPPLEIQNKIVEERQKMRQQNEQEEKARLQIEEQAIIDFEAQIFE